MITPARVLVLAAVICFVIAMLGLFGVLVSATLATLLGLVALGLALWAASTLV